tara:strand:- start:45 stop:470 length:426 start_codon:yes stop_codon:yes gene_type:complete
MLKSKSLLISIILFLVFSIHTNFFKSLYLLSFREHEERMFRAYGWGCDVPNAYQFTKQIIDTFPEDEKVFFIHNFHIAERYWLPPIDSLFLNLKKDEQKKKIILLHYYKDQHSAKLLDMGIDLNDYKKVNSVPGCAYFEKK